MRKNIGPKSSFFPEPVCIISTYDENNIPNAMTAAWAGISDTNEIGICISKDHKTTKNILEKKCFCVSCATVDTVIQADYVGMISGNKNKNKIEECGWHTFKSCVVDAPIIEELPFTLECKLKSYDPKTGHMFGKIVDISVDSKVMTKDKVDIKKLKPVVYDSYKHTYNIVGEKIADAYKCYKKLNKTK